MKHIIALILALAFVGCVNKTPHKLVAAPVASVTLTQVRLQKLSDQLDAAGQKSASVDQRLDKAQQLAAQLAALLDQIDSQTSPKIK